MGRKENRAGARRKSWSAEGRQEFSDMPCFTLSLFLDFGRTGSWLLSSPGFCLCGAQARRRAGSVVPRHVGAPRAAGQTVYPALQGGFPATGPPGDARP